MNILASKYISSFFIQYLAEQRNVSPETIKSYRDCFKLWIKYLRQEMNLSPDKLTLSDLNRESVLSFLTYLETRRYVSISTRNLRLAAIKCFARYVAFFEPMYLDNASSIRNIAAKKTKRSIVPYLKKPQYEEMLASPNVSNWIGLRDHTLLLFLIRTGLRVSEAVNVNVKDVHFAKLAKVYLLGKGRKERAVPLVSDIEKTLSEYLSASRSRSSQALFITNRGARMSVDNVQRIVRKHSKVTKVDGKSPRSISPHVLRHTAAMSWLTNGVDIMTISNLLGHEDVTTTMKYMHVDLERMKIEMEKLSVKDPQFQVFEPTDNILAFLDELGLIEE